MKIFKRTKKSCAKLFNKIGIVTSSTQYEKNDEFTPKDEIVPDDKSKQNLFLSTLDICLDSIAQSLNNYNSKPSKNIIDKYNFDRLKEDETYSIDNYNCTDCLDDFEILKYAEIMFEKVKYNKTKRYLCRSSSDLTISNDDYYDDNINNNENEKFEILSQIFDENFNDNITINNNGYDNNSENLLNWSTMFINNGLSCETKNNYNYKRMIMTDYIETQDIYDENSNYLLNVLKDKNCIINKNLILRKDGRGSLKSSSTTLDTLDTWLPPEEEIF